MSDEDTPGWPLCLIILVGAIISGLALIKVAVWLLA